MARNQCANFTGKDGCLVEIDGCLTCRFFRVGAEEARCRYFETWVLPADGGLEAKYYGGPKETLSRCDMCRHEYVKTSNRQRYCTGCRERAETEARRRRDARYRSKKTMVKNCKYGAVTRFKREIRRSILAVDRDKQRDQFDK